MKGIKAHTHQDREKIIQQLIPKLQEKFGNNFIALAGDGSFAREEDADYSDLEVIVFLKELPEKIKVEHTIVDGMLIVIVPETKESIISKYLDVTESWYASSATKLSPIVNKEFVDEINAFVPDNIEQKCLEQIKKRWYEYQEITAKVLNAIQQQNKDAFAISFPQMIKELLIILSYLNQQGYYTLGSYITQARKFAQKPEGFDELIDLFVKGNIQDIEEIKNLTENVFGSLENVLNDKGLQLYQEDLFSILA